MTYDKKCCCSLNFCFINEGEKRRMVDEVGGKSAGKSVIVSVIEGSFPSAL